MFKSPLCLKGALFFLTLFKKNNLFLKGFFYQKFKNWGGDPQLFSKLKNPKGGIKRKILTGTLADSLLKGHQPPASVILVWFPSTLTTNVCTPKSP